MLFLFFNNSFIDNVADVIAKIGVRAAISKKVNKIRDHITWVLVSVANVLKFFEM